jgi:hypothetical protein
MREIAARVYDAANRVYDLVVISLLPAFVASVFLDGWFERDLFTYVVQPLGVFLILRFIARRAWGRYRSAHGLRGFVPRKAPWAP